jgi:tetratricopeptide (TPR) repeat protein
MKTLKIFLPIVIITVLLSCSEDFLHVTNENELSSDNFYSRIENFDMAVTAAYDAVKNLDLFGQTFYIQSLLALPHESDYWNAQNRNEVTAADGNVYIAWRGWYRVVARANDVIENAPKYSEKYHPNDAQLKQLDQIVGQVHFLRGLAYFHLVRLWGEELYSVDSSRLAVPLILKVATTRSEMMIPRASVGQVYKQIISDFKKAESLVPSSWDANNIARINKSAVQAFLGQTYLYMNDNENAKTYFEQVLASGKYSLVSFSEYDALFQGKNEFSDESLWELNYTIDMQQNIWENGLGSGIALVLAPPGRGWSNCTPHAVNIYRFGSDPRAKVCFYAPTDLAAVEDGSMQPAGKSEFNVTGHSFRKYVPQDYAVATTNRNSGTNVHMMRLADVYLMYAEVMNNLSQDAQAAEYMNKVRRRAYGHDPDIANADVDYNISGTQLRDSIREERFRELFAEGHRWYDICRWKIVDTEVLKYNDFRKTQGEIIFQPRDYYYPIPLSEVDINTAMKPSTGY